MLHPKRFSSVILRVLRGDHLYLFDFPYVFRVSAVQWFLNLPPLPIHPYPLPKQFGNIVDLPSDAEPDPHVRCPLPV